MLDLKCRLPCVPVTAQTAPGFLSAPRAVYAPLLTPQKYARESGKTYGHSRLMFSLLAAGYEVILAAELFSTVVLPCHRLGKDTTTIHAFRITMYYGLLGKHVLSRFAHGRYALLALPRS